MDDCLPHFLPAAALESLEILIIDDGSTDDTLAKAKSYEKRYPETVRALHKENGGHGSAINFGVEQASGRFVKVVDGDDWVDSENLLKLLDHLAKTESDLVFTGADTFDEKSQKRVSWHEFSETYGKNYDDFLAQRTLPYMHDTSFRTALLRANYTPLDEQVYYEDIELCFYQIRFAESCDALPFSVTIYRIGLAEQSSSLSNLSKHYADRLSVNEHLIDFYEAHELTTGKDRAARAIIAKLLAAAYITTIKSGGSEASKRIAALLKQNKLPRYARFYPLFPLWLKLFIATRGKLYPIIHRFVK